jgi:signal transduction histidine kinase
VYSCEYGTNSVRPPKATKGVLDLTGWDFEKNGVIDLNGEYEFFWHQLLGEKDFAGPLSPQRTGFIDVPGLWNNHQFNGMTIPGNGYATYRLTILMDRPNQSLYLKILEMGAAGTLFINGRKVYSYGEVAKYPALEKPGTLPAIIRIPIDENLIHLVLQVSNYSHKKGGIYEKLALGTHDHIQALRESGIAIDLFLFGSIFIIGLYHFGLFILRRSERSSLFFGIFCITIALRVLTLGEKYFLQIFPNIEYEFLIKLQYLTFYFSFPIFIKFIYSLFPRLFSKKIIAIVTWIGFLFSTVVIAFPVKVFSHTLTAYQLFSIAVFIYTFTILIIAAKKNNEALIFLVGFIIIFLTAVNDMMHAQDIIKTGDIFPFGLFIFILSEAFLLSIRSSRAFTLVETQRREVKQTNQALENEIIDRIQAERLLKESHERFLNVLDSIEADVYVADMETHEILFMNQHMKESFKNDFTGQKCWKAFRNESGKCKHCTNDQLHNHSDGPTGVIIRESVNPVTGRWYINYDRAITWDGDRIVRLQVATDVTDRKLAEEKLKKVNDELEKRVRQRTEKILKANKALRREIKERKRAEKATRMAKRAAEVANQAKSEFLANMSHELRTPLNHIIGFTEIVIDKHFGDLNDDQEQYLTYVHGSSKHLLSMINDILDLSKIESGKLELTPSEFNIKTLLRNSLAMFKEKTLTHAIKLSTHLRGIPAKITADERKIKQIMYNLLSNAIKFTPDGGKVTVAAELCRLRVDEEYAPSREGIKISVTDTGIGIQPEDLERIFNPFEQVDQTTSRQFQGTGLGLSLSKRLVELHGGRIWASSDGMGKGSSFRMIIPI